MTTEQKEQEAPLNANYEINFAEFPLFIISRGKKRNPPYFEYNDEIFDKEKKELIKRKWMVSVAILPTDKDPLGFGSESTLDTLFELFQIWKEDNFASRDILFESVANLLRRMKKPVGKSQHYQVKRDLRILRRINVVTENSFYVMNKKQRLQEKEFWLFNDLDLWELHSNKNQSCLFQSKIEASNFLWQSVLSGNMLFLNFNRDFYHQLRGTEKPLVLNLEKRFNIQKDPIVKRKLQDVVKQLTIFAENPKHQKQQITRACKRLQSKGYDRLEDYWFEKSVDGETDLVLFKRKGDPVKNKSGYKPVESSPQKENQVYLDLLVQDILEVCKDEHSKDFYYKVASRLDEQTIRRAIAETKEIRDCGQVKTSLGRVFTSNIKRLAKERDIDL